MDIKRKISALLLAAALAMSAAACGQLTDEELAMAGMSSSEETVPEEPPVTLAETDTTTEPSTEETTAAESTEVTATETVTEAVTTEADTTSPAVDNQPPQSIIGSEFSIIPGISIGMTKNDVFNIVGDGYISEEYYDYKERTEYRYKLDRVELFGVDMISTMFFEFDTSGSLACFGYHIGEIENDFGITYPYTEAELSSAYKSIYSQLAEHYGEGLKDSLYADMGIKSEYSWDIDGNQLWFIWGINMWGWEAPSSYEFGCNDIVLSVSVP